MPYSIGEKGSYGCSGYPVVKDGTSEVMGCHDTAAAAQQQISAINMSEAERGKKKNMGSAIGQPHPASYGKSHFNWSTPVRKPERSSFTIGKADAPAGAEIKEGDYVMGETMEGTVHGRVEHIMWDGGVLGSPEGEYSLQSMPPENPAMSVRIFEEEDGGWEETAYSIGMMYKDAKKIDISNHNMSEDKSYDDMYKSDSLFDWGGIEELKAAKQAKTEAWFAMRSEQKEIDMISSCNCGGMGVCNYCQEGYAYKADIVAHKVKTLRGAWDVTFL
jgi:hypothetical protein